MASHNSKKPLHKPRKKRSNSEKPIDNELILLPDSSVGSLDHLTEIDVKRALKELTPELKTALMMKHYAGFGYEEIAAHERVSVGTAKHRVGAALQLLRNSLGLTHSGYCNKIHDSRIAEYVYGILPKDQQGYVRSHLQHCMYCRELVREARKVMKMLDRVDKCARMNSFVDIHADDTVTAYSLFRSSLDGFETFSGGIVINSAGLVYVALQGIQANFEQITYVPNKVGYVKYKVYFPTELQLANEIEMMLARHEQNHGCHLPKKIDAYRRLFYFNEPVPYSFTEHCISRIPRGAKIINTDNTPCTMKESNNSIIMEGTTLYQPDVPYELFSEYELPKMDGG